MTRFGIDDQPEERLFKAALAMGASEWEEFIVQAAGGDAALLASVRMLLEAHEEEGDAAAASLGGAPSARRRWNEAAERPGMAIGGYELVEKIGEGGMGNVWEARQHEPVNRTVALKIVKLGLDTEEVVSRFERERQLLAGMRHPNIAHVIEAGNADSGRPYFVMEFVEGTSIAAYCEAGSLSLRQRLLLFTKVCSAVEHAHLRGVMHRDLKPQNILVTDDGEPKVIDFGVAKAVGDEGGNQFTRASQVLGTPAYMSPEQAEGDFTKIDTRTDVYSLGVVVYELLSGKLPFDRATIDRSSMDAVRRLLTESAPSPLRVSAINSGANRGAPIAKDLEWVVMKAISREPTQRFSTVAAFREDIERFLVGEAVVAAPPGLGYRMGKFVHRHRLALSACVAVALALCVGLFASLVQGRRADEARRQATLTVSDLFAKNGLAELGQDRSPMAALWFAKAAVAASEDPERLAIQRLRNRTSRDEFPRIVRAFETPTDRVHAWSMAWHPRGTHLCLTQRDNDFEAHIFSLLKEAVWKPDTIQGSLHNVCWSAASRPLVGGLIRLRVSVRGSHAETSRASPKGNRLESRRQVDRP